ncbi:hypothetical protein BH23VER1_BH23VER1_26100 [soil metagenome]
MGCRKHVPGWHVQTDPLEKAGKLRVLGIVQEQHGDRARLFHQWKEMDWPILVDSYNLLGVEAVPITVLVRPDGTIEKTRAKLDDLQPFLQKFAGTGGESTEAAPQPADPPVPEAVLLDQHAAYDETVALWEDRDKPSAAEAFRLGVLYRKRFDSPAQQPGDFGKAVAQWTSALERQPDQYIWRRRIQQYGPRLDKPYAFYDWVTEAREAIVQRGEVPVLLVAEPGGAEIAEPGTFAAPPAGQDLGAHPDPHGRLAQDTQSLVRAETVAVPGTAGDRAGYRIHLTLRPDPTHDAHWNNEAGVSSLWIALSEGWWVSPPAIAIPAGELPAATSTEARTVEFEVTPDEDAAAPSSFSAAAFYYVCEGESGTCLYLRNNISIPIPARESR